MEDPGGLSFIKHDVTLTVAIGQSTCLSSRYRARVLYLEK